MNGPLPAEPDDASDLERRARAQAAYRRTRLDALYQLGKKVWRPDEQRHVGLSAIDRGFVIRLRESDLTRLTDTDRNRLDRLVWDHRRSLPPDLRPALPPFDPIVREMEIEGV